MSGGFAVLDLETTGLFPGGHDRIVEIAILRMNGEGCAEETFSTLINPERDLGPVSIHGLTASDVLGAPTFRTVAGEVLRRLRGRVVVGHNVGFDLRFLRHEVARMGLSMPPVPSVCTMQLFRTLGMDLPSHRLSNCCAALGIPHEGAHSALADASAAAALFRAICQRRPSAVPLQFSEEAEGLARDWPEIEARAEPLARAAARLRAVAGKSLIHELVARLPLVGTSVESDSYQNLLERVVEDRRITREEASALEELARSCGLGRDAVREVHQNYLRGAVALAKADGIVTDLERRELDEFAVILGLDVGLVESLVADEEMTRTLPTPGCPGATGDVRSLRGCTVCFTGELNGTLGGVPISREVAHVLATNAGLVVAKSVTKRLDILVVSDPDTQSSKARKAREYGIRVIVESAFWRTIDAPVG